MTERVLTMSPDRSLRDAAQFMTEHNVGAAVILDPEEPGPGIVTERDLVRSLGSGEDPDKELIRDHLTSRATFADAEWDLQQAADAMAQGGFRHLVVVHEGHVAGIISMRDIIHVWRPADGSARQREAERAAAASAASTQMRPPWASTIRRQTASPMPDAVDLMVGAREHAEDPGRLVGVDADAVVAHRHDPLLAVAQRGDLDPRGVVAAELDRVGEQVLQHAAQLARIALDLGQLADLERRAVRSSAGAGRRRPRPRAAERDRLGAQLAGPRVDEHAVDQVAGALGARPQLAQHVGATAAPRRAARACATSIAMPAIGSFRSCATTSA